MAAIYADENTEGKLILALRERGHDVLTMLDEDLAGKKTPDSHVFARAVATKRLLVTHNRKHFIKIHAQNAVHHGIMICTFDDDFAALTTRIHEKLSSQQDFAGQLIRINRPNV